MRVRFLIFACLLPSLAQGQELPERWTLVEEVRIGALDGPSSLTQVSAILSDRDRSTVYVTQHQDAVVRIFDAASGKPIGTIGRRGAGPGEFELPYSLGWKGDTLWVTDWAQQRVGMFSPSGEHLRTQRIVSPMLPDARKPALPFALSPDGSVLGEPLVNLAAVARGQVRFAPIVRMTREGEVIQTLAQRPVEGSVAVVETATNIAILRKPFAESTLRSYAPNGSSLVLVSILPSTARFHVTRLNHTGDTIYHRAYRYTPRPFSATTADSIYRSYSGAFGAEEGDVRAMAAAREHLRLPAVQPPVQAVVHGTDGSTWLRREISSTGTVDWLVLDPAGRIRATARAPASISLLALDGKRVWGVLKDEFDVPYVIGLQVRAGSQQ